MKNPPSGELQELLQEFEEVVHEPNRLPPSRKHDHTIPLKEGTQLVNFRPYRYSSIHKNELEKIIKELTQLGVIRPSHSPFCSPAWMGLGDFVSTIDSLIPLRSRTSTRFL